MSGFEIAIAGSDQASALLAGLLAREYGKKVLLVQDLAAPYRLQRDFHLSFPMATRPETFSFISGLESEVHRLLVKIAGRQVLSSVAPLCLARSAEGSEALHHVAQMARYFGLEMDRAHGGHKEANVSFRVRGGQWVRPRLLWPALVNWVSDAGVQLIDGGECKITAHRDGSARIELGDLAHEAELLVLADGVALRRFGHKGDVGQDFVNCWGTSLLTEQTDMQDAVILQPEKGFCAWQQANGTLGVIAQVSADHVGALARANINSKRTLRRAGQAEYVHAVSKDAGPVVGRFSRSGAWVVAGFGQSALHAAPAVARLLAGRATEPEAAYLEPRSPGATRGEVAEFAPVLESATP